MKAHLGNPAMAHILDQGPEWKRVRSFFQTDLLSPQAARQYIPAIAETTKYASQGVVNYKNDLNTFMEDASFDMFSSLTLGSHTRITDPHTETDPRDIQFCRAVKKGLTGNTLMTQDPKEMVLGKYMGITTTKYKEFQQHWVDALEIATEKIQAFLEKRKNGTLNQDEQHSYLQQALNRLEEQHGVDNPITEDECVQLVKGLLGASVE